MLIEMRIPGNGPSQVSLCLLNKVRISQLERNPLVLSSCETQQSLGGTLHPLLSGLLQQMSGLTCEEKEEEAKERQ